MANGGTTGDDLGRLQVQVDATRTELGEVAGAVSGLTELVTDLIRRSASTTDHQGDRWQARLGSLETRLEMLETAIRVEVERIRGAAGTVDALADDFKSTVGGTQNLVDLAAAINDRLSSLETLERGVRGAAQDVAASVEQRLDRDASDRHERDESLAERLAGVLERIDDFVRDRNDLNASSEAARAEVATTLSELVAEIQGLGTRIHEATADDDHLDQLLGNIGERLDGLAAAMRQVVASQPDPRPQLESLAAEIGALAAAQPDPRPELEHLAIEIGALAATQPDPSELVARVSDRITSELAQLRDAQPATDAVIGRVASILNEHSTLLAQLQAGHPQLASRLDQVATNLGELVERANFSAAEAPLAFERLDRIAAELTDLRAREEWVGTQLSPLTERVDSVLEIVHSGFSTPDVRPSLDQLTQAIAELRDVAAGRNEEWAANHDAQLADLADIVHQVRDGQPDVTLHLDQVQAELADLRSRFLEPDALLAPVSDRLDRLAIEFIQLRETNPALARISAAIAELRDTQPDLGNGQEYLAERLDRIATELAAMRAEHSEPDFAQEFLSQRLDAITSQIGAFRTAQPDPDALIDGLASILNEQSTMLTALQAAQPQVTVRLDQLAADLAEFAERPDGPAESPLTLERLDHIAAEITALRVAQPDLTVTQSFLAERLDRIAAEVAAVRVEQPDPEITQSFLAERLDRIAAEVSGEVAALRAAQPDPEITQSYLAERLDRIAAELSAVRVEQPDLEITQNFLAERLDRIGGQLATLRTEQPDSAAIASTIHARLDELGATLTGLQTQLDRADAEPPDVAGALEPLSAQLATVDARAAATTDAVLQLDAAVARTNAEIDGIVAGLAAMREAPDNTAQALAPFIDRLAIVVDSVSSMHGDVTSLADSISMLRSDRAQLVQIAMETNGRLDLLSANVAEIRESRPDFSSSFVAVSGLLDSVQANVTDTHDRIDALGELVRRLDDDRIEVDEGVAPLVERLDLMAAQAASTEQHVAAVLESMADTFGRVEVERATAMAERIDDVRQAISGVSDRNETALMDVLERFEEVRASVATSQEATRSIEAALRAAAENDGDERLGELTQELALLSSEVKSTVHAVMGLGTDFTGLRSELRALAEALPDRTDADAEVRGALARLDEAIGARDQQLRDTVERLDNAVGARDAQLGDAIARLDSAITERESDVTEGVARLDATLANRDASVRDILSRLDEAIGRTSSEADFADLARQFDAAIAELRRDVQSMYQVASNTDVLDMVRSLAERDPNEAAHSVNAVLHDVRAEIQSMSGAIGDLRSDVRRQEPDPNAAADLVATAASATSAVSRLEGRMDGEFDTVGRQMEALGTLLGQVIDAVHRVESQVIGVQPVSDKMRTAAASVLETLRANVRQRAATRRGAGAPPELGAGPR